MSRKERSGTALVMAACVLAGCRADAGSARVAVEDSSGVRIVRSSSATWGPEQQWHVASEPLLRIGTEQGDSLYTFDGVRGVDLLEDGHIAVLDGGSAQLRVYDGVGRLVWSVGRRGQGPGEFEQPVYLGRTADGRFAIWDRRIARLTMIARDGSVMDTRSFAERGSGQVPIAQAVFPDGTLLATYPSLVSSPRPGTVLADTLTLWKLDADSDGRERIAILPGPIWLWTGQFQLPVPFTANPARGIGGDRLAIAAGPEFAIAVYDGGRLIGRHIVQRPMTPLREDDVRRVVDYWVENQYYGAPEATWREWLPRMPVPRHQPAYDRIVVSADGHVWARQYVLDPDWNDPATWDIFGPAGTYLGAVVTPARLDALAAGNGTLAGVLRDELDVEYVAVYRVESGR